MAGRGRALLKNKLMPTYIHDMMHCSQHICQKRGKCYRYWLGQHIKESGFQYASYYHPEKVVSEGCQYFLNLEGR